MELLCPAGNLSSLKTAIDSGADAVYIGLKNDTNARHFAGLNFSKSKLEQAVSYVKQHNKKLHLAINTFANSENWQVWKESVDLAADIGVNVLIAADISVLNYARTHYPDLELHLSVQASATNAEAINYYAKNFNIQRVVLPRVLSIHQVKQLARSTEVELEVFAYGSLCIMAEGRCHLSSYLTGESPNMNGVCSPAKFVSWQDTEQGLESRLNNILIDRYSANESAGYPTLCKGRFNVDDTLYHTLEEPTSLNSMELLPQLINMGVSSIKIEGRQRSSAYVREVTQTWRQAIDACLKKKQEFTVNPQWQHTLASLSEGNQTTLGAYHKQWQ
ncbi:ubiquinone anaerobic biosynthesis protein UbiU [Thalassotalea marina]|uniref:Ubiquinone biosynthesis protein UbiU n=1 Tax=Thalassotalea marina TaxID=1673741 RepID=A0A919BI78_9GAMM|nr:peptidase U32 family protein [Thalassotalea marina]GHF92031.1 protease [Thalassotalea marina]